MKPGGRVRLSDKKANGRRCVDDRFGYIYNRSTAGGQKSITSSESDDAREPNGGAEDALWPWRVPVKSRRIPAPSRVPPNSLLQGISQGIWKKMGLAHGFSREREETWSRRYQMYREISLVQGIKQGSF